MNTQTQQFIWNAAYEVGDEDIDAQHRKLFELADALLAAEGQSELTHCAMLLYQYVRVHFTHEEAVMRRVGYPDRQRHLALHMGLLDRLNVVSRTIAAGEWRADALRAFMNDWLLGHIRAEDTRLAAFIKS